MTNDEIIQVVQAENIGKTILVRGKLTSAYDLEWHEKSVDKPWDFTNREYKVKPMSVEEFINSQIDKLSTIDNDWCNGQIRAYENVLSKLKELENK